MRTIRIELEVPTEEGAAGLFGGGGKVRLSTEVIVEDGDEAEAGADAKRALGAFMQGYGDG